MPEAELFGEPSIIPTRLVLDHYWALFRERSFWLPIRNSLIVAGATTALSVTLGSLSAYAIARLRFRGKSLVPYLTFATPLTIWLLVGFFRQLPAELEAAADEGAATHLAGLAGIVLAGVACFASLTLLGASLLPSAVAGTLYALLPYTWVALEIRGAFAETWALVFYPLVLAGGVLSFRQGHPVRWLPWAVAGSLASHLVMTAWAVPVLAVIALLAAAPEVRWNGVWRTAAAGALGAGKMALFILRR
ncbi:MAG TPA: hypothetical protein VGA78_16290 [Gemmatimonadales bacterium]|jgi:hypothetical protein